MEKSTRKENGESNWIQVHAKGRIPPNRDSYSEVVYRDAMYCFGGYDGMNMIDELYVFEFSTNKWRKIHHQGTSPTRRSSHSAVVFEDSMFVFGGKSPGYVSLQTIWKFTFATNEWKEIQPNGYLPQPRCGHTAIVRGKSMFVFGGWNTDEDSFFGDLNRFDFETNEWSLVHTYGNPPSPRYFHCSCYFNDGIRESMFIYGGFGDGTDFFNELHKFDFETNTWSLLHTSESPPKCGSSMVVYGNSIYVFGQSSLYRFEVDQCKWTKFHTLQAARPYSPVVVNQNYIWITGGYGIVNGLDNLWKFPLGKHLLCAFIAEN